MSDKRKADGDMSERPTKQIVVSSNSSGDEVVPSEKKASAMPEVILYSYWRSSCSWRVRIALYTKNIGFQYKAVHLVKDGGEQFKPEYTQLNSMKEVPTLVVGDKHLTQSIAMLEYLEEIFPKPSLLPVDPYLRAQARSLTEIINAGTQPLQNLRVLLHVKSKLDAEEMKKWASHWIGNGLAAMEKAVKATAGKYCVGDNVTYPDCCLIPQLYNARRFKMDMALYPTLMQIESNLTKLPAFEKAHPSQQPDAQN